jgi:hypothetical protein
VKNLKIFAFYMVAAVDGTASVGLFEIVDLENIV